MEDGTLAQGCQVLVGGLNAKVGARVHGRFGKSRVKMKMSPMGLIHHQDLVVLVDRFRDGFQVRREAKIGRAGHQHRLGVGCLRRASSTWSTVRFKMRSLDSSMRGMR